MERWLPIAGYEGLYEISSLGRIRSLDHVVKNRYSVALRHGRILRQTSDKRGYLTVNLSKKNVVTTKKIHRLVAAAFIAEAPHADAQVNHLDFNKANNAVENLEWCRHAENHRHAVEAGRLDGSISTKRAKKLDIERARLIKAAKSAGEDSRSIAARFGVSYQTVDRIASGAIWARA